jgi:multiple sugar transport system ATP-binding protein
MFTTTLKMKSRFLIGYMSSLSLQGVNKIFGKHGEPIVAVDSFDLEIEDGEFVVLVGPSGSGKSTLLRTIAGLETPTDGRIVLGSKDITTRKPSNRDIAMVFQNYALYPHLNARGNMSFGLKMQGEYSSDEIESRVQEAADIMEIGHLLDKMPNELSGGQKQRVALGRAIVRYPDVFLMDEPLSNLDAKLRRLMRTEIQQLQRELDVTTIYVTHDQTEAMTMGDRIVIMNKGEVQQVATPVEAYYQPANTFVAGFIGTPQMNLIPATIDRTGETVVLNHPDFTYRLSPDVTELVPNDVDEATVGVRPDNFELVSKGVDNAIEATINVIEPLGKERLLYFELDGATHIASISGRDRSVSEGDAVYLGFSESDMHLFDGRTGNVIKNCALSEEESTKEVFQ